MMSIVLESATQAVAQTTQSAAETTQPYSLSQHIKDLFQNYISNLDGQKPQDVYELFLGEFEKPFMEAMLSYTRHNQSKAAIILGLSRGTLRKKLKQYDLL
jgi:Fis family transcriptional regulator, factor for inversion stimulation protein